MKALAFEEFGGPGKLRYRDVPDPKIGPDDVLVRVRACALNHLDLFVRLGIPSVVEAALLPRLMGSGRAAWLVLTGDAIDARHALEWGLIEEISDGEGLVQKLLAGDREALRMQKQLLHLWQEASLATSVAASIERFAQAHSSR